MRRILVSLFLSVLASALVIGGVALVGKLSRDRLHQTIHLDEVQLKPEPDENRERFLAELQYETGLEDEINLLEDGLTQRLASAFLRHPCVAGVDRVSIGPGKRLQVELHYRVAVLAVQVDGMRTIDSEGILLPKSVPADGLLVLRDMPLPPLVESGNMWADTRMRAASRTAAFLHGDEERLRLTGITASEDGEVTLATKGGSVIRWGKPPGDEVPDEKTANQKLARLRRLWQLDGSLDHPEGHADLDLRMGH